MHILIAVSVLLLGALGIWQIVAKKGDEVHFRRGYWLGVFSLVPAVPVAILFAQGEVLWSMMLRVHLLLAVAFYFFLVCVIWTGRELRSRRLHSSVHAISVVFASFFYITALATAFAMESGRDRANAEISSSR